jgi:Flp pilus assembly protein TadD
VANSTTDTATIRVASPLSALCAEAIKHHRSGRYAAAIKLYERILSFKSDLPEALFLYGHGLAATGKIEAAISAFQRSIALKPNNPESLSNWGLALAELGRFDEAEVKCRQAITLSPGNSQAYNDLGILLKDAGRLTEAAQSFEQAIRLAPETACYYDNLAAVRPFVAGDQYITALEALAENTAALSTEDQIDLHFALAKAYDNIERPEAAFRELLRGNRLKRQQITYDEAATLGMMDRQRELVSREFIEQRSDCGEASSLPIFIVGMTRSGTTLIEQILASHPQVFGAGELPLFDQIAGSMRELLPGTPAFPEMMREMSPAHFRTLGARYVDKIAQQAPTAARIIDKMTVNFLFLGLIHLALPNAVIIHAVRDPADTCVSSFAAHFSRGQEHTYDLAELGRYYRSYQSLMTHWHNVLPPGRIMDVRYEELVADLEAVTRRIVSRCGLAWDDRCLAFHQTQRPVRTASAAQVRKPIYTNSVGRWRKFGAFLGPLFAELGRFTVGFDPLPASADQAA